MPRVAKPKAAKSKAAKKQGAALPEKVAVATAPATETFTEAPERAAERPPESPPAEESHATNGDSDTDMVLRPPTKPIETSEQETEDERVRDRERRRITGAETAPALKINIAELQAMSMTDLNNMAKEAIKRSKW